MRFTARNDPAVRLRDYAESLRRWSVETDLPIVFCENSGADLRPLQKDLGDAAARIEWLGFTAPEFPERRGKGYGEALILRHALERSCHIGPDTRIVKITGRLFVENTASILGGFGASPPDLACDLNLRTLDYSECRLFVARPAFLCEYLLPEAETMDEDAKPIVNFERVLSRAALRAIADGMVWRALPHTPRFRGFSGTYGYSYRNRMYVVRELARWMRLRTDHLL